MCFLPGQRWGWKITALMAIAVVRLYTSQMQVAYSKCLMLSHHTQCNVHVYNYYDRMCVSWLVIIVSIIIILYASYVYMRLLNISMIKIKVLTHAQVSLTYVYALRVRVCM